MSCHYSSHWISGIHTHAIHTHCHSHSLLFTLSTVHTLHVFHTSCYSHFLPFRIVIIHTHCCSHSLLFTLAVIHTCLCSHLLLSTLMHFLHTSCQSHLTGHRSVAVHIHHLSHRPHFFPLVRTGTVLEFWLCMKPQHQWRWVLLYSNMLNLNSRWIRNNFHSHLLSLQCWSAL